MEAARSRAVPVPRARLTGNPLGPASQTSRSGTTFPSVTFRAKGPTPPTIRPRHLSQSSPTPPRCPRARRPLGRFPTGDRVRRRGSRTSGPVHHGCAVGSRTPPYRFRSPWLPARPRAPCAGPGMRTEASGLGPGSAGARTVRRGSPRPRGRGWDRRSLRASARFPKSEQGREKGKRIDKIGREGGGKRVIHGMHVHLADAPLRR